MSERINVLKNMKYRLRKNKNDFIVDGVLTIPQGVTSIHINEYSSKKLVKVKLPKSIRTIESSAFFSNNIKQLSMQEGIQEIGNYAFAKNEIEEIELPNSLEKIGENAFFKNQLKNISIPGNVKVIGEQAFSNNQLTEITLSEGNQRIKYRAFSDNQLETIDFPNTIQEIESLAFSSNKLTHVTLPSSIKKIGNSAFMGNKIESVSLPANITKIAKGMFAHNKITELHIPDTVEVISESAFASNVITNLHIPKSVKTIENEAFSYNKIVHIHFESGVTNIEEGAFRLNKIESLALPSSLLFIGRSAFSNNKIKELSIPNSVLIISESAFFENKLKNLIIPGSVQSIGGGAFSQNELEELILEDGIKTIHRNAFYRNKIKELIIPDSVMNIEQYAFSHNQLTRVVLPSNLMSIEKGAFSNSPNLNTIEFKGTKINMPQGVNEVIYQNGKLLILGNDFFEIKMFDSNGVEELVTDENLDNIISIFGAQHDISFRIQKMREWEKIFTSKSGMVDKDTLQKMGYEIIFSLPATRDNANTIKQGLRSYNEIKNHTNYPFEETRDLFKMCYAIGLFDGDKTHSNYVKEFIYNQLERGIISQTNIHNTFDTVQLDKGYRRKVAYLIMQAMNDFQYRYQTGFISRIYNDYDEIVRFIEKAYKGHIRDLNPRIWILEGKEKLNSEEEELLHKLKEEVIQKERSIEKVNLADVKYYIDNNLFRVRKGNEELSEVMPMLAGMSQKDFDIIQDYFEQAKGTPKEIIQTKDLAGEECTYQWSSGDNPYNVALGPIVGCCARKNGAGEDIMIQSMINPLVQNLLLRDKNQNIVAKATAYYNKKEGYILFNNVEAKETVVKATIEQRRALQEALKRAVKDQVVAQSKKGVILKEVRMGMLRNDLFGPDDLKVKKVMLLPNYSYRNYSGDANNPAHGQGILYEGREEILEEEISRVR